MTAQDRRRVTLAVVLFLCIYGGLMALGVDIGEKPLPNDR